MDTSLDRAWALVLQIAMFSRYDVNSDDDKLEDAVATLNRLRAEARDIWAQWSREMESKDETSDVRRPHQTANV